MARYEPDYEKWQTFANEIERLKKEIEREEHKVPSDEHPNYCEASYNLERALEEISNSFDIKPKRVKKTA